MKISLVSSYASPEALGLRYISSYLKRHGHEVRMIFMTTKRDIRFHRPYPPDLLADFIEKVRDVDLIGIALMTNTYYKAVELTRAIKAAGVSAPVIWGGIHPTVLPDSCIEHADMVCIGEGEEPMLELADALEAGRDPSGIANLWIKRDGRIIRNDVRSLVEDLDRYPFPDFELQNEHYVAWGGRLVPASPKVLRGTAHRYRLLTTRGCPYGCAFCCNNSVRKLYRGKGSWVRTRSIENVIAELEAARRILPTMDSVSIVDDTFFVRSDEEFERFAALYRERIGLPFEINTHPATITPRKIDALVRCGCREVEMGIQSGSRYTNFEIFQRRVPLEKVAEALAILGGFPQLRVQVHYIVNNPWEPEEAILETLQFVARHHPRRIEVYYFPLALFPGTALYERAVAEGLIPPVGGEIYQTVYTGRMKRRFDKFSYLTLVLMALVQLKRLGLSERLSRLFIYLATARTTRFVLDRRWFAYALVGAYYVLRACRNVVYQPIIKPIRKWRMARRERARSPAGPACQPA